MGQALIRAKQADENDFTAVFTFQFCLGALIYAAFFTAAPYLATYHENPLYADLIRVSTFIFLLKPFTLIRNTWLSRQMEFEKLTYIRLAAGAVAAAAALSVAAAGPASAWPMPFTPEQQRFINQARNAGFPGDADAVMQAGLQACQMAFSGQSRPDVIGALHRPRARAVPRRSRTRSCQRPPPAQPQTLDRESQSRTA